MGVIFLGLRFEEPPDLFDEFRPFFLAFDNDVIAPSERNEAGARDARGHLTAALEGNGRITLPVNHERWHDNLRKKVNGIRI